MIYNNLGITAGLLTRRPFLLGKARRSLPLIYQIGGINQGPGSDVFVNGNVTTAPLIVPVTTVTTDTYTATASDYFLCVSVAAPVTITLPASVTGRVYQIKDCDGDAAANNITVNAVGTTIDGAATAVINVDWGSLSFVFNGTEWNIT